MSFHIEHKTEKDFLLGSDKVTLWTLFSYKFEMIQKRAIKWISGRKFDHLSDKGLYEKEKEFDILAIRFKFLLISNQSTKWNLPC